MTRQVFFSFHYDSDYWRASQIRNIGVVEGNKPVSDNKWEEIKAQGDEEIKNWIDNQLANRSCTIVLIGKNTAGRKWIKYEIRKTWNDGKGLLGIYVHNLKDRQGKTTIKGRNPFLDFSLNGRSLDRIVNDHNPPRSTSKGTYSYIEENIENWIEEAIEIRENN